MGDGRVRTARCDDVAAFHRPDRGVVLPEVPARRAFPLDARGGSRPGTGVDLRIGVVLRHGRFRVPAAPGVVPAPVP